MVDYCDFDSLLTDGERVLRDTVRRWVGDQVDPIIAEHYQAGTFPRELVSQMAELGLFGIDLPEKHGCAGGSMVDYGLACMELEAGDSGVRSFMSVQSSLVMFPIYRFGSEEHREKYLPELAAGRKIGCFGLTEPDFGSNPSGMRTRAVKDGDGWVLNGNKMWITNGEIADVAVVWAQTDEGVRGFVIDTDTAGFSARSVGEKLSLRASVTSELVMEDCRVPDSAMLPGVVGLRGPLACLNKARFGIAWGGIGAMRACYQAALDYATDRVQFSKPIAGYQLTQQKLVTMVTEITKALFMTLQVGRLADQGKLRHQQVSMIKRNNIYWALETARTARTILGANGISADYSPMRHASNLESVLTYEGTHEIHTLILGADITGLPAFE